MKNLFLPFLFFVVFFSANAQSVTITQPNGGEVLYGCQNYAIQWTASGVTNNWNIDYSLNNGAIWTSVASNLNILPLSSVYSYNWSVPMVSSNTVLVRIRDYSDTTKQDISNAVFTIQLPINVVSPNGGEVWQGLSNQTLSWNPAGTSGFFNVFYSLNNGSSWISIVNNIAANNYNWTVPNSPSTQALIRVTDATTSCQLDISNAIFEISAAQPILNSPNGGEVWAINTNRNITWNTSTFHSTVKLEYSTDNGVSYNLITNAATNSGSYSWLVPNTPSNFVIIRASNTSGSTVFDVSNAVFTINLPTPILTSPNGGEIWRSGDIHTITWNASTVASNVMLEYSRDNGVSWGLITNSTANTGTYNWTIPKFATTTQALVRITNTSFPSAIDTSNAVFTIRAPILISFPINVNDTLTTCNSINVLFNKNTNFENRVVSSACTNTPTANRNSFETFYKLNDGSNTWISMGSTTYGSCGTDSYSDNLVIPDVPAGAIKFLVIGYNHTSGSEYWQDSTAYIPLKTPNGTIVVTNPNGGVNLNALTSYNITWTANGTSGFFDVLYGNGTSFSTIASNINGNSYSWAVPNTTNSNIYVRVRDNQNICRKDNSDAANTIIPAQPILTAPNGGEVWKVNSNQNMEYQYLLYKCEYRI